MTSGTVATWKVVPLCNTVVEPSMVKKSFTARLCSAAVAVTVFDSPPAAVTEVLVLPPSAVAVEYLNVFASGTSVRAKVPL